MFDIWSSRSVCLIVLLGLAFPTAAISDPGDLPARIAISEVQGTVTPVAAWDAASPQRLVRIEETLYQEDSGSYFRVVEDVITVRLTKGVGSWSELVQMAEPDVQAALRGLVAVRTNRLGIVDLTLPDRDPAYWAELVFRTGLAKYAEVATHGEFLATSTDPLYGTQWALNNTGQTGGTSGADIKAEAAWNISTGTPSIIVGILDSGCEVNHVDLNANIWVNVGETPNNGVDDDSNGFIDDYYGWDFENNNNNVGGTNFHGTHVAGIIIAPGGNGIGIAGLAGGLGTAGVRGMTVQVGNAGPVGSIIDDSILYAADNGAQIITMSLTVGETSAINDALDYALDVKDVFIDCASGNNGGSVGYPAKRPEVMAVGSTDDNDNHSSFSNPGPELEVSAPGSDIRSTQLGNSYGLSSGTSFSAPYVAALAGLIRGLAPRLSSPEVRQLIIDTVDDVGNPGWDTLTGHGRVNAFRALSNIGSPDGTVDLDAADFNCSGTVQITVEDINLAGDATLLVTAMSDTEPAGEDVSLSEGDPGVYTGSFPLDAGAATADGVVQVRHGDTLTVTYIDVSDGNGGLWVHKYATASIDCAGPTISGVSASNIAIVSATIVWTTEETATSVVYYGEEPPLGDYSSTLGETLEHSVTLTGLSSCTSYRFQVESVDALGNVSADDNHGFDYSFQTMAFISGVGLSDCGRGDPRLDSNLYGCGETVQISLTDLDLDTDANVVETALVLMTSSTEPNGEWITLTETAPSSTRFEGAIDLDSSAASGDAQLGASAGDLITVTYLDEDDGTGSSRVATYTSLADCAAPTIENLRVTAISATRAEIEWTSDEPSTSRVEFGPTPALGFLVEDSGLTMEHRLPISPFNACEQIHFSVSTTDAHGASREAGGEGQPLQFNLNRIGGLIFHDNFETDSGWTLEGEWERGRPGALGSSSKDPLAAYSGTGVLGTDLSGSGTYAGDYEPAVSEVATSPVFDPGGVSKLELILRRKLGVNAVDTAKISAQFFFTQVIWASDAKIDDNDWIEVRYSLGSLGMANSVQLKFSIDSVFPSHSYGWNIDEVIVKDATQPDYLACADCSGAPAFGGVAAVHDPDPCGSTGLEIRWQPAPAWGTGGDGTYEVHRATTADFVPDETNRIASGLNGTSWTDLSAPVDTPVWYVVRARNDEDCAGGAGLSDSNSVRLTATETVFQSGPSSVGQSVRVAAVGQAHVRLSWDAIPGASGYIVRRSQSPDFNFPVEIGTTAATFFENINAVMDDSLYAYRVFAVNACREEGP